MKVISSWDPGAVTEFNRHGGVPIGLKAIYEPVTLTWNHPIGQSILY
jgi:hypothetical protein